MKQFSITESGTVRATVVTANYAADALRKYVAEHYPLAFVIVPLRTERPIRIFTHNGQCDYLASQWSAEVHSTTGRGLGRFWIHD